MELSARVVEQILDLHRQIHQKAAAALRAANTGEAANESLADLAFGLGMVHATTPGHGKAILFGCAGFLFAPVAVVAPTA